MLCCNEKSSSSFLRNVCPLTWRGHACICKYMHAAQHHVSAHHYLPLPPLLAITPSISISSFRWFIPLLLWRNHNFAPASAASAAIFFLWACHDWMAKRRLWFLIIIGCTLCVCACVCVRAWEIASECECGCMCVCAFVRYHDCLTACMHSKTHAHTHTHT